MVQRTTTAWQKRLETASGEREMSVRLVFEYGSYADGGVFVRQAADVAGGVHLGSRCSLSTAQLARGGAAAFVEAISMSPNPGYPPPAEGVFSIDQPALTGGGGSGRMSGGGGGDGSDDDDDGRAMAAMARQQRLEFAFPGDKSKRFALTIRWRASFVCRDVAQTLHWQIHMASSDAFAPNMTSSRVRAQHGLMAYLLMRPRLTPAAQALAPLELRYHVQPRRGVGAGTEHCRRVVVQLPGTIGAGASGARKAGDPVLYPPSEILADPDDATSGRVLREFDATNGWVIYTGKVGKATVGPRSFGRTTEAALLQQSCTVVPEVEPRETGSVVDIQRSLELAASAFTPLTDIVKAEKPADATDGSGGGGAGSSSGGGGGDGGGGRGGAIPDDVRRVFEAFDADGSGDIDVNELELALKELKVR